MNFLDEFSSSPVRYVPMKPKGSSRTHSRASSKCSSARSPRRIRSVSAKPSPYMDGDINKSRLDRPKFRLEPEEMYQRIISLKQENNHLKEQLKLTQARNLWVESLTQAEIRQEIDNNMHPPGQPDDGYYGSIISKLRSQIVNLRYSLQEAKEEIRSLKFDPRFSQINRLETENKQYIKEIHQLQQQLYKLQQQQQQQNNNNKSPSKSQPASPTATATSQIPSQTQQSLSSPSFNSSAISNKPSQTQANQNDNNDIDDEIDEELLKDEPKQSQSPQQQQQVNDEISSSNEFDESSNTHTSVHSNTNTSKSNNDYNSGSLKPEVDYDDEDDELKKKLPPEAQTYLENEQMNIEIKHAKLNKSEEKLKRRERLIRSQKKLLKEKEKELHETMSKYEIEKEENERRMLSDKMRIQKEQLQLEKEKVSIAKKQLKKLSKAEKEWNEKISENKEAEATSEKKYRFPADNFDLAALDDVEVESEKDE